MANHASAKKRARQTVKKTERNSALKARMRGYVKAARDSVAGKTADRQAKVTSAVREVYKAAAKNIIKDETASRLVSRLMKSAAAAR
jgi:small subunit ribosomal protein S20